MFKNFLLTTSTLVFVTGLQITPAAAEISEDRAALITKSIQDSLINFWGAADDADLKLSWDGAPETVNHGDYIVTTLPSLRVEEKYSEDYTVINNIELTIQEEEDGLYPVNVTIPSELKSFKSNDDLTFLTKFDDPEIALSWSEKFQTPVNMDISVNGMSFVDVKTNGTAPVAQIGKVTQKTDLEENADGTFTGPSSFSARDLTFFPDKHTFIEIASAAVTSDVDQLDFSAQKAIADKRDALGASEKDPGTQDVKELLELLFQLVNSSNSNLSLNDISFKEDRSNTTTHIDGLSFIGHLIGLKEDQLSLQLGTSLNGLTVSNPQTDASVFADFSSLSELTLSTSLKNVPTQETQTLLTAFIDESEAQQDKSDVLVNRFKENLLSIWQDNGATLNLDSLTAKSDFSEMVGHGSFTFNPKAVYGLEGGVLLTVSRLENLNEKLQSILANPDVPEMDKQSVMSVMAGIGMVQAFGKPKGSDLLYQIDVKANGMILLNGQDISMLMGALK